MKAISHVEGRVAVLDRPDVDTDQIIPKQFLKRIERTGYGQYAFFDWRFDEAGNERPGFELNQPQFAGARILLAGRNFGCGSSREHAAWALQDYGLDVIIAPSFGDIFRSNAAQTGIVLVELPEEQVKELMESVDLDRGSDLVVDLEALTVTTPAGKMLPFEFDASTRYRLLNGLDDIGITLQHADEITDDTRRARSSRMTARCRPAGRRRSGRRWPPRRFGCSTRSGSAIRSTRSGATRFSRRATRSRPRRSRPAARPTPSCLPPSGFPSSRARPFGPSRGCSASARSSASTPTCGRPALPGST